MFDSSIVVQSAMSSFNNAAIAAPSFLWSALLMLPLFALVYFFGNAFLDRLNWNPKNRTFNFTLCAEITIWAWLVLMAGNYDVLRDMRSILPFVVAGTVFILTASIIRKINGMNLPIPVALQKLKHRRLLFGTVFVLIAGLVGLSGMHTWWGFLIQAAAFVCGTIVGLSGTRRCINPILMSCVLMFVVSTMMLMQPEFFRFGQLGSLTIIHLVALMIMGALIMAIIALRYINPRGRIHNSAFVKLKWMARFMICLCLALFILTESVPVFVGFIGMCFVSFVMSVWHAENVPENLSKKLWALALGVFGIMTSLPLITALGILYWINLPKSNVVRQIKFLL